MKLTMKPWVVVWTIVLLCVMPQSGRAQNKQLEKELKKEYKTKLKEYKKTVGNWMRLRDPLRLFCYNIMTNCRMAIIRNWWVHHQGVCVPMSVVRQPITMRL